MKGKASSSIFLAIIIDEAYALGNGPFAIDAVETLVAALTDPQYKGLVVILAIKISDFDSRPFPLFSTLYLRNRLGPRMTTHKLNNNNNSGKKGGGAIERVVPSNKKSSRVAPGKNC